MSAEPHKPVRLAPPAKPLVRFAALYIMERWDQMTAWVALDDLPILRNLCDEVLLVFANDLMTTMQVREPLCVSVACCLLLVACCRVEASRSWYHSFPVAPHSSHSAPSPAGPD